MKIALATYGTRGDVEPSLAVGCELMRRGHDVRVAVPPDQVGLAEAAGFSAVPYGPDSQKALASNSGANLYGESTYRPWQVRTLHKLYSEDWEFSMRCRRELNTALMTLAEGADVLFHGQVFEDLAANVAEYYDIPMVTLHYIPLRPNGQFLWFLPPALSRMAMSSFWWLTSRVAGNAEKGQRRELGLPKDSRAATRRITDRGSLELQAYDEVCFPGLATEWARWKEQRSFVGTLTLEMPTNADEEVESWIAAGSPPICFAFGSMALKSPADTIAMISEVCGQLGERALVCAGSSGFSTDTYAEHVKVVETMNYATVFPGCRAVVHHGGAGTMAAALRAGIPHLVLWSAPDRRMRGAAITRLKVGTARRFLALSSKTLVSDLRQILAPEYLDRARAAATQMRTSIASASAAADFMEAFAGCQASSQ
ncbi:glycosyl transferase family 1 [Mycobacterium sp. ENV421]|uniref:glycosyltransferase n=1 Tax=Mycobacterium sp. ENV421 TaxID=1213407 RepID=UPI000CC19D32|nr:glycosyltransferase [Mycobacterium sp. ENV421]PND54900.1 glycosyl transferase family 1 [Mycobacterium sp. ENV421]